MIRRRGLTLIELLISMFVMGVVIIIIGNLFIGSSQFATDEQGRIVTGENASRIFANLDQTIRQGTAVLASATINSITYTSGDTTLVFSAPTPLTDGSLSSTLTDTLVVTLDASNANNQRLTLVTSANQTGCPTNCSTRLSGTTTLTTGVKDVYFRYNNDTITSATDVTVTMRTISTVRGREFNQINIIHATFRNHA
ncbi:MAG: prepilin-type N-terminal cleavage/methylation domain-containing protein [Candidatus Kerfeldbacteria bacterium]|nr:prepilin-type N-terminal cleavage/methylation domain-containing protein [Candidatus Kerfeldbacteria bacterium]